MARLSSSFRTTFSPLKNPNFALYFAGQGVSLIGTFMQQVAQQWLVWELTHDARMIGVASALAFLPMLFLGPLSSALADRVDRRRLLIATQTADMLLAFSLAALVLLGVREVWPVLVLAALLGVSSAFTTPAFGAFIGDLSGMAEVRSAYTIYGMVIETARLLGPAFAGQIIASMGTAMAFALNGLSFIAVIISLIIVRAQQTRMVRQRNPLADFAVSVRFMVRSPRIVDLLLCRIMVLLFIFSSLQLSAPIADQILKGGADLAGNMLAASGAGALVGALLVAPSFQQARRAGVALCLALAWSGLWLVITSTFNTAPMMVFGIFMYSVMIPVVLTNVAALTLLLSPGDMRARLAGALQMVSSGVQPLGALAVGWMGAVLGPLVALRVNGSLMLLLAFGMLAISAGFRNWIPSAQPVDAIPPAASAALEGALVEEV